MENDYFLLSAVLLILVIAFFIMLTSKSPENYELTGDFCQDFSKIFPGCWCAAENELINNFNFQMPDKNSAQVALINYYNDGCIIECFDLSQGFYNCFCESEFLGTINSKGEFYKTECGV